MSRGRGFYRRKNVGGLSFSMEKSFQKTGFYYGILGIMGTLKKKIMFQTHWLENII